MRIFGPSPHEKLQNVIWARNSYNSSVVAANGFISGKRIYAVREDKKRLEAALWEARDEIADLIAANILTIAEPKQHGR